MAVGLKEIFLICRLCLTRDEADLVPITELLDSSLTIADLRRFTGVQLDAIHTDQRTTHAICLKCARKLKKSAAFRKICITNDYQFRQLWRRSRANSKNDSAPAAEILSDSEADPLEVEFLVDEDGNSDRDDFDDSTIIGETCGFDANAAEEIPLEDEVRFESNNSYNESSFNQQHPNEINVQSVATITIENHVPESETLYSANYIELGEPHSDNDEPENEIEWTFGNSHYLNIIKTLQRSDRDKSYSKIGSILVGRTSHKRERPLCETCGKLVTNLVSHNASHSEEFNYLCPHCPIKMKHSSYLIRHIQSVHFNTVVKSCATCNIGFKHYTTYRSHMHTEHGVGQFHECLVCSRRFPDACRLRKHMKRFHNTEEYDCEVCGRIFKMRDHLKRHQKRVHTMGQPYKCSHCPRRFKCASYRKNHELAYHSGIVLECYLCEKSFRYKYQVNAHMRKMHPDANSETETTRQESDENRC